MFLGGSRRIGRSVSLLGGAGLCGIFVLDSISLKEKLWSESNEEILENWSATHSFRGVILRPESTEEAEKIIHDFHTRKQKIRCVGSGISPNGMGFSQHGTLLNMGLCDKIIDIHHETNQVTVESGILVGTLLKELEKHGLTLQNLASIKEQQIGGWIQGGCHGTGATLPPVDDQVVAMELLTPGKGKLLLSQHQENPIFQMAKCGLGVFGVVTRVTLQCVPRHQLIEETRVMTKAQLRSIHTSLLQTYRHVRYMWIPNTDKVVVVLCNPLDSKEQKIGSQVVESQAVESQVIGSQVVGSQVIESQVIESQVVGSQLVESQVPIWKGKCNVKTDLTPFQSLYLKKMKEYDDSFFKNHPVQLKNHPMDTWSFADFRDKLLEMDPLNPSHVAQVNQAEAEYWKLNEGYRIGYSDEILGFECGGQQCVLEGAFPSGKTNNDDLQFVGKLLQVIEQENIPAPAPIEQRWSASSTSLMSPASEKRYQGIYSWVGIIMYLCSQNKKDRDALVLRFQQYSQLFSQLLEQQDGAQHWAKIEILKDSKHLQKRIRQIYPVEQFNQLRNELDPNGILSNDFIESIFGETD